MGGEDEGDAVELLSQKSGHGDVPGVGVDKVDLPEGFHLGEIEGEGVDGGLPFFFRAGGDLGRWLLAGDVKVAFIRGLLAPAVDLDLNFLGEFAAEILDVDAGSAIDVGRVLAGHKAYAHGR